MRGGGGFAQREQLHSAPHTSFVSGLSWLANGTPRHPSPPPLLLLALVTPRLPLPPHSSGRRSVETCYGGTEHEGGKCWQTLIGMTPSRSYHGPSKALCSEPVRSRSSTLSSIQIVFKPAIFIVLKILLTSFSWIFEKYGLLFLLLILLLQ